MFGNYGFPGNTSMQLQSVAGQQVATLQPQQDVVRVYEKALWSTYAYADATAVAGGSYRLFATQKGQTGQGHSSQLRDVETNMREGGRMQSNEAFDCHGLASLPYTSDNTAVSYKDMHNTLFQSMLLWDFSSTKLEVATTYLIGAGGGIFGSTADTGDANGNRHAFNNGTGAVWLYRIAMILSAGTNFAIEQLWSAYASVIDGGATAYTLLFKVSMLGRFQSAINS